jgi:hypothetical protein
MKAVKFSIATSSAKSSTVIGLSQLSLESMRRKSQELGIGNRILRVVAILYLNALGDVIGLKD